MNRIAMRTARPFFCGALLAIGLVLPADPKCCRNGLPAHSDPVYRVARRSRRKRGERRRGPRGVELNSFEDLMPPVEGCSRQDYEVLIVIGVVDN